MRLRKLHCPGDDFSTGPHPDDLTTAAPELRIQGRGLRERWQVRRASAPDPVAQPKAEVANTSISRPDEMEERHIGLLRLDGVAPKRLPGAVAGQSWLTGNSEVDEGMLQLPV